MTTHSETEKSGAPATKTPGNSSKPVEPQKLIENTDIHSLLPGPEQQKAELAAYQKLRQEFSKRLAEARATVNLETIKHAAESAGEALKASGDFAVEAVDKAAHALRKDIAGTTEKLGKEWHAFSDKTGDVFAVWRDRSTLFLGRAAKAVGEWLEQAGEKSEHLTYHTGGLANLGTFECMACGEHIELRTAGHLPPCPKCFKTEFRRIHS